jgi:filamentous hemagglutinin family protein
MLCVSLIIQPSWGQPLVPVISHSVIADAAASPARLPDIIAAGNNVPIVDIVAPTAKGVSHNKYSQFNIDAHGLIINNSQNTVATQLAGNIDANANLTAGVASIILNEVTSASRSQLNGLAEVAGQPAEFILANPNGITCSGCGFINTPRATLTTGTPTMLDGDLDGFSVNGGDLVIGHQGGGVGSGGLNASNIDRLDILTRAIEINTQVYAKDLNLIAGRNDIDYSDLNITSNAGGTGQPNFALDVAALGGMYANQIFMVGTEAGVGVNMLGEMASSTGDMILRADGSLVINKTIAGHDLILESDSADITLNGTSYSANNTSVVASGTITNNGLTIAENGLEVTSSNLINAIDAQIQSFGTLDVQLIEDFISSGEFTSDGALSINADNIFNRGVLGGGDTLTLTALDAIENYNSVTPETGGVLFSVGDMNLYGQNILNRRSDIFGLEDIVIAGDSLGSAAQDVLNVSATLESFNDLTVHAQNFINRRDGIDVIDNSVECSRGDSVCGWTISPADWYGMPNDTTWEDAWLAAEAITYVYQDWDDPSDWSNPSQAIEGAYQNLVDVFLPSTREPEVYVGNDLNVTAGSFRNEGGFINTANNITANVGFFTNITRVVTMPGRGDWSLENESWLEDVWEYEVFNGDFQVAYVFYEGYILAGNDLTINATTSISNGYEDVGYYDDLIIPDVVLPQSPEGGSAEPEIVTDLNLVIADPFSAWLDLPEGSDYVRVEVDITEPTGSLFSYSYDYTDPATGNMNTLISTNASVARYVNTIGSDYLLDLLGLDPDQETKRLGDGFYENRLIRKAITQTTGNRFLHDVFTSDTQQLRYLMDSAAAQQQSLQLSLGVALTADQVNALVHDIVWLEEKVVNGETVLVPVLYLAGDNNMGIEGSSLVAKNIQLNSDGRITNHGEIDAFEKLSLNAKIDIINQGGWIAGNEVSLSAQQGDIINKEKGDIIAGNSLSLNAVRDIQVLGSAVISDGSAEFSAGRDFNIVSTQAESDYQSSYDQDQKNGVYHTNTKTERRNNASVFVGGDVQITTGRDLTLKGANVSIDGSADIDVGRDVNVLAVENKTTKVTKERYEPEDAVTEGGKLTNRVRTSDSKLIEEKFISTTTETVRQQESHLNIGGNTSLKTGRDVSLVTSRVTVAGAADMNLGGTLNLKNRDDVATTTKRALIKRTLPNQLTPMGIAVGSTQHQAAVSAPVAKLSLDQYTPEDIETVDRKVSVSQQQSTLAVGQDLFVVANDDINNIQGSTISGLDTTILAGGDINNQSHSSITGRDIVLSSGASIENSGGSVIEGRNVTLLAGNNITNKRDVEQTSKRDGDFITTNVSASSTISASEDLTLQAGQDIINQASTLTSGGDGLLQAGGDMKIESVADRERRADNNNNVRDDTRHSGSQVSTEDDLGLYANNDIGIHGSQVSSKGNLDIVAGGKVDIASVTDEHYVYVHDDRKGSFGSRKSETTELYQTTNVASELSAQGDLSVAALNNDVLVKGSSLNAGGDISFYAGDEVSIVSAQEIYDYSHHESKSSFGGLKNSSSSTQKYEQRNVGSNSKSAGDTVLTSGGNINIVASGVEAANDVEIEAGKSVNIVSGTDESRYTHYEEEGGISLSAGGYEKHLEKDDINDKTNVASDITAGNDLHVDAAQDIAIVGSDLEAGNNLNLEAQERIQILSATESHQESHEEDDTSWGYGTLLETHGSASYSESELKTEASQVTHRSSTLTAGNDLILNAKDDLTLEAALFVSGGDTTIKSEDGAINFLTATDTENYSEEGEGSTTVWQYQEGEGAVDETVKHTEISAEGDISITAKQGILVQYREGEQGQNLKQALSKLSQENPDLLWMSELQDRGDVDWQKIAEAHEQWDYESEGLTEIASLAIVIVVTVLTAGAGTAGAGAALTGASSTAGIAASNAAVASLASQATISFANNKGDIGAVFDDLGSSETVKSIAMAATSAGFGLTGPVKTQYTTSDIALMAASAVDPEVGKLLAFTSNNFGGDIASVFQNGIGETIQYVAREEISRQAEKMGLTSEELNLILMVNSFVGREVAGTTYDKNKKSLEGFLSRDESGLLKNYGSSFGVFWDLNDTVLNAQAYLDAISQEVVDDDYSGSMIGHSLGAWRVNNLLRQGLISDAITLSLPLFDYPVAGSVSLCGERDGICGGNIINALRAGKNSVDSPSSWDILNLNHRYEAVPEYKRVWDEFQGE